MRDGGSKGTCQKRFSGFFPLRGHKANEIQDLTLTTSK